MLQGEKRTQFGARYWLEHSPDIKKYQLSDGSLVSVLPHLNLDEKLRRAGIQAAPLVFSQRRFAEFLEEGQLAPEQLLMPECPICAGTGAVGPEGQQETCSFCGGHGKALTHFACEILKLFDFIDNGKPLIDEEGLERKNRIYQLQEEIGRKKKAASEAIGLNLAGRMQEAEWAAREKTAREQLRAMKKVEKEMTDEIEELERLQSEQQEEQSGN